MDVASVFKTKAGEDEYLAAYAKTLAFWPVSASELDLPTSYGLIHAVTAGPEPGAPLPADSTPLLLLPATNASSTMWYANVKALAAGRRIICLDLPGHTGKTVPSRGLAGRDDAAAWILEALDALRIDRVAVTGLSVGGWMALNLALRAPGRVTRVAALSPVGAFGPISLMLLLRMLPMGLGATRERIAGYIRWIQGKGDELSPALVDQFIVGMQNFNFRNPAFYLPRAFPEAELRSLAMPVLLLLGENEVMFSRRGALKRATALLPHLQAAVIPGAGHFLSAERPDLVNQSLLAFFGAPTPAGN